MSAPKLKRFYSDVVVAPSDGRYEIHLDGRPLRTPIKNDFTLKNLRLAEAVAEEWRAQKAEIVPETMPITKLAFTAVDRVAPNREAVVEQIAAFANSDAVCYRATEPQDLVARQSKEWDPVLEWARSDLGVSFRIGSGIGFVAQEEEAVEAITRELSGKDEYALAALYALTANSGSLLLSLAVAKGHLDQAEAFRRANCDEIYQAEKWGSDAEAQQRMAALAEEFASASALLKLLQE
jgi:chaperone required for assembly of F1-ATPase